MAIAFNMLIQRLYSSQKLSFVIFIDGYVHVPQNYILLKITATHTKGEQTLIVTPSLSCHANIQ